MDSPEKLYKSKKVIFLTGEGMCGKSTMAMFVSGGSHPIIEFYHDSNPKKMKKKVEHLEHIVLQYFTKNDKVIVCMPTGFGSLYKLLSKEMKRRIIAFKIGIEKGK